jgi:hypothetical protein
LSGFSKVVVRAELHGLDRRGLTVPYAVMTMVTGPARHATGRIDDREARLLLLHAQIGQHHVGRTRAEQLDRFLGPTRQQDLVAFSPQDGRERAADRLLVITTSIAAIVLTPRKRAPSSSFPNV